MVVVEALAGVVADRIVSKIEEVLCAPRKADKKTTELRERMRKLKEPLCEAAKSPSDTYLTALTDMETTIDKATTDIVKWEGKTSFKKQRSGMKYEQLFRKYWDQLEEQRKMLAIAIEVENRRLAEANRRLAEEQQRRREEIAEEQRRRLSSIRRLVDGKEQIAFKFIPMDPENNEEASLLGEGAFARTHKVIDCVGIIRAAKIIDLKTLGLTKDDVQLEAKTLAKLEHEFIVRYVASFEQPDNKFCIVMEFLGGGSLEGQVGVAHCPETLSEWLGHCAAALNYIHERGVIHRDIKLANILIDESRQTAKLADFGLSKVVQSSSKMSARGSSRTRSTSGTLLYMSPQAVNGFKPSATDDMWSLGCTFVELGARYSLHDKSRGIKGMSLSLDTVNRNRIIDDAKANYPSLGEIIGGITDKESTPYPYLLDLKAASRLKAVDLMVRLGKAVDTVKPSSDELSALAPIQEESERDAAAERIEEMERQRKHDEEVKRIEMEAKKLLKEKEQVELRRRQEEEKARAQREHEKAAAEARAARDRERDAEIARKREREQRLRQEAAEQRAVLARRYSLEKQNGMSLDELYQRAMKLKAECKWDEVLSLMCAVVAQDDNDSRAWSLVGHALIVTKASVDEQKIAIDRALELDTNNGLAHALLGEQLYYEKDYDGCERELRLAIELDKNCAFAYNLLGHLLQNVHKKYDQAEQMYRKAIEVDPKFANAYNNLGHLLHVVRKKYDQAEQMYRKAIELDPKYANAYNSLGHLLQNVRKKYDQAEQMYRKAIEVDPKYAIAYNNLGHLLQNVRKKYDQAEQMYRKAIELDPKFANAYNNLGVLLKNVRKKYDEAEQMHRKAIEFDPNHANAYNNLGFLLQNVRKKYDQAEQNVQHLGTRMFRKAIEVDPNYAIAYNNLGHLLQHVRKNYDQAEQMFRKAIELDPNYNIARNNLSNYSNNVKIYWATLLALLANTLPNSEPLPASGLKVVLIDDSGIIVQFTMSKNAYSD
eukprot:CAMPEP_0197322746 /NCGR_PEP_ID=MMETSP0891-20130614/70088_1 /TAXON_ID=44058 ORGANISM="Aureoumbra lagunensis, Strain CCMP1510" /NCGR_SAMPLE_ID=MMETSP0891 /ASSEMBLY_ACC=CAM_ASM_000534 /LENGTH=996 /DNA_ID=CAMNT_0042815217 /DNA_START=123 /DNA_END=3114 /DNA_ORIENTATION=+